MRRRIIIAAMTAMLMTASAGAETMYVVCGVDGRVNIRSQASQYSSIEGYTYPGDAWEIKGRCGSGSTTWYKVDTFGRTESSTGWISGRYLSSAPPQPAGVTARVVADGRVAIRQSIDGKRLAWIRPGDTVRVLAWCGDWAQTDCGYIMAAYLEVE